MSVDYFDAAFECEALGPTTRFVLVALGDHADAKGCCFPSIARLARRTGFSTRSVQKSLNKLRAEGYIEVAPNAGRGGTNVYVLNLSPARGAPPQEVHPARDAPHPRTSITPTPAGDSPEPSENHQEPSEKIPLSPFPISATSEDQGKSLAANSTARRNRGTARKVKGGIAEGCADTGEEFEAIWNHYPRKVGKAAARAAWTKARAKATFMEIAKPLRNWIDLQGDTDVKYIPHFARWLNEERWEDDPHHGTNRTSTTADRLDRLGATDGEASAPLTEQRNLPKIDLDD